MPIPPMNVCPVCNTSLKPGASQCSHCDADLRLLAPEGDIAVDFYNQGLDCVESGDRRGALEKMQAAIAADPTMVDAYIVVGKLLAQTSRASETEQAIEYWKEAKQRAPNREQSQTIESCLNRAETLLVREHQNEGEKKRNLVGASVLGAVALAGVCGVIGFFLNRPRNINNANSPSSGFSTQIKANESLEAVKKAINRSDIKVEQSGASIALSGETSTEAEKVAILGRATLASKLPVNGRGIKILSVSQQPAKSVSAEDVEKMLREKARKSLPNDPLRDAFLKVEGGGGEPLKITGYCYNSRAGMRAANLVRSLFPEADKVITSGLELRTKTASAVSRPKSGLTHKTAVRSPRKPRPIITVKERAPEPDESDATQKTLADKKFADARRTILAKRKTRLAEKKLLEKRKNTAKRAADRKNTAKRTDNRKLASSGTYKVRRGETILSIVRKFGKRDSEWKKLWRRNGSVAIDPNSVPVGATLSLPPGWRLRGDR